MAPDDHGESRRTPDPLRRSAARLAFFERLLGALDSIEPEERRALASPEPARADRLLRRRGRSRLRLALDEAYDGRRSAWTALAGASAARSEPPRRVREISLPVPTVRTSLARVGWAAALLLLAGVGVWLAAPSPARRTGSRSTGSDAGELTGRVLGPAGVPLDGARVYVVAVDGALEHDVADTRTDAAGAYRLSGLPPIRFDLYVQVLGTRGYSAFVREFELDPGETRRVTIRVPPTSVPGRVRREDDGRPLSSSDVQLVARRIGGDGPNRPFVAFADAEGRFAFVGLAPGPTEIWVHPRDEGLDDVRVRVDVPSSGATDSLELAVPAR